MLDIVYPFKIDLNSENDELKFSLRSIDQHVPHRNVFIAGDLPDWIDNVLHIDASDSFPDRAGGRYKNVLRKIRAVCRDDRVSDQFILMNDDFFFLRDCSKIETYSNGTLQAYIDRYPDKSSQYYNALVRTLDHLKKIGIERPLNFAVHYPIVYDKAKFLQMVDQIDWINEPCSWRTIYGNMFAEYSIEREDTKLHTAADMFAFLESDDHGDLVSSNNKIIKQHHFKQWLADRFPHKSKYEK